MATGKSKRNKNIKIDWKRLLLIVVTAILLGILYYMIVECSEENLEPSTSLGDEIENSSQILPNGVLILTMIDVGQADSFLIEQNGKFALIDCGTRSTGKDVVNYLKEHNVSKLDYVIGTHPHDDHMGGMYDVITNFEIGEIIIPKVTKNNITSNWYLKLMDEIKNGGYTVVNPELEETFELGDSKMKVIGPIEEPSSNLNNYSIVIKLSFGEMDVLMTGDCETDVEKEIIKKFEQELDVEVLKMGHHGSDTSSSDALLDITTPDYALISAKVGNKYGHPIKSTMDKLKERNVEVYRTDECGTVLAVISANDISFKTNSGDYLSGTELEIVLSNL